MEPYKQGAKTEEEEAALLALPTLDIADVKMITEVIEEWMDTGIDYLNNRESLRVHDFDRVSALYMRLYKIMKGMAERGGSP